MLNLSIIYAIKNKLTRPYMHYNRYQYDSIPPISFLLFYVVFRPTVHAYSLAGL